MPEQEIICIRALTSSDMGWFGVHRPTTASKQRAVNINADVAIRLLNAQAVESGGVELNCRCVYPGAEHIQRRRLWKVGKNWRFGGPKLEGNVFRNVRKGDFLLLRSPIHNDGSTVVTLNFISANTDPETHQWLIQREPGLQKDSMTAVVTGSDVFRALALKYLVCSGDKAETKAHLVQPQPSARIAKTPVQTKPVAPMPRDKEAEQKPQTLRDRIRSPHIMSQMLKMSGDLSAEAHYEFMKVLELLAGQLRSALTAAGMISVIDRGHKALWNDVRGLKTAFVDGGMANLSMLGSAPVAARVGGYIVTPGQYDEKREEFVMVKHLIDELYIAPPGGGVYSALFPDMGALRDAARITVESAGAVHMMQEQPDVKYLFLHGALINPVSRYTDIMEDGRPVAAFPNFSATALGVLLPANEQTRQGKDANFIRVYLRQLQLLEQSDAIVCGVVERESQASSV